MPHAEKDTSPPSTNDTMGEPMTNGERPSSLFLSHLTSYPVVSDSISTYRSNPYGAKSLSVAEECYQRFFVPVEPYLKGPYSYIAPYLAKADSLGDQGLSTIDSKVPIIKEETATLKEKAQGIAFLPFRLGAQGKEYVFKTYEDERKKTGEDKGIVPATKALISTEIKVAADALQWLANFLSQKKEEGKKMAHEKFDN